ncbi:MAG: hypothetical protein N2035_09925 [Chthoniobacterales bacterium]|nr:hypothetical protein [Chthoniobacterales bacterium]
MEQIPPDLQAALLCEDVRNEVGGLQSLIGVLPAIVVPKVPVGLLKLCLWTRWCGGSGKFVQRAVIMAPDDRKEVVSAKVDFFLDNFDSHTTNVHVFGGVQLAEFGLYHIEIFLDEELKLRFPLPVLPSYPQQNIPPFPHPPIGPPEN